MESYHDHGNDSSDRQPPLAASELLYQRALQFTERLNDAPLTAYELSQGAWAVCRELNTYARRYELLGERAHVPASGVIQSRFERLENGEHTVRHYTATGIGSMEVLTGRFIGYGYYIAADERRAVVGTRLVTGYEAGLAFSEGALVAFCPLDGSQPEFESEQKQRRIIETRYRLQLAMHDLSVAARQAIEDVDDTSCDEAIENIHFLRHLSLKMELLLARDDIAPDHPAIDQLIELISEQLDLPMTVDIQTSSYQGETALSPTYVKYPPRQGEPRRIDDFEARLIIARSDQRYGLFFAGIKDSRMIQIPMADVLAIQPSSP